MKKILNIFLVLLCSLVIYISCDDNEYIDPYSFPFEIELNSDSKGYTGKEIDITSSFLAKYNSENVDHSYLMLSNMNGSIINSEGDTISTANWIPYKLNQKFIYLPKVQGEHNLQFKFKNKWGFEVIKQMMLNIENSLFSFSSSVTTNNASIGVPKPVKLLLKSGDNQPKSTEYRYKFNLEGLSGELFMGENLLPQNEFIDLDVGNTDLIFIADQATEEEKKGKIKFLAKDNFNQEVLSEIELKITTSSFDFTASALESSILINETSQINFSVTPFENVPNTTYKLKFETVGQNGTLDKYQQNQWIDIKDGDFNFDYKGLTVGTHIVKFTVMNNWNSIETKEVTIEVKPYTFNFSAIAGNSQSFINQPLPINFNISPNSGSDYQEFQMKYQVVKGSGVLQNYEQGVFQNVEKGNFSINFTPDVSGEIEIKFTTKNQNNYEVEKIVKFSVNVPTFEFTSVFQDNTLFVDVPATINNNITFDKSIAQKFQIKYEILEGDATIDKMIAGQYIDVKDGASNISIKPKKAGNLKIKLTVKSSFDIIKEIDLIKVVSTPDFTFNANLEFPTTNISDPSKIFYSIANASGIEQKYQVKYEILEGSATFSGVTGEWQDLASNNGNFIFTPTKSGNLKVKLFVRNQYNLEKEVTLTSSVNVPSFEFVATSSVTSGTVSSPFDVAYSVTSNDKADQTYKIKYEVVKGSATIEGISLNYSDLISNNGTLKVTPNTAEDLQILISVMSNFNVIKTQTIILKIANPTYDFTASYNDSQLFVEVPSSINYNINNNSSVTQTYKIKYEIMSGSAQITNMIEGQYVDATTNGKIDFKPTQAGNLKIKLTTLSSFGVTKEIILDRLVTTPDFTFSANLEFPTTNISDPSKIFYSIANASGVEQKYQVKYEILEGSATFSGVTGEWQDLASNNGNFIFTPTKSGNLKVKLFVRNQYNIIKEVTLTSSVNVPSFEFVASSSVTSAIVKNPFDIAYSVKPNDKANQTFKVKYEVVKGSATIEGLDLNYKDLTVLSGNFKVTPNTAEDLQIVLYILSNYGIEKTQILNVRVSNPTYDFTASYNDNQLFVEVPSSINYNINNNSSVTQTYKIKYEIISGSAQITNMIEGQYVDATTNGKIDFKPTQAGNLKIKLTTLSSYGVTKEIILDRLVTTPDFTFSANLEFSNININDVSKIFYSIANASGIEQKYQVKYEIVQGEGNIKGLIRGDWQDLATLNGNFNLVPTKSGNLQIKIYVRNEYNIEKTQILNANVNVPSFEFVASSSVTSANVNNPFDVVYNIKGNDNSTQNYKVKYQLNRGSATIEGLDLSYKDISVLDGKFRVIPTQAGDLQITFFILNNYGVEKTQTINLNVTNPSFDFDVINLSPNANVNFEQLANIQINNTSTVDQIYEVKYEVLSGNATIEGMVVGSFIPAQQGTTQIKYTPKLPEPLVIRFTAKNNYGVTKTKDISVDVKNPDFQFSSNIIGNTKIDLNQEGLIENTIIDDSSLGMTYTLRVSTNKNGVFIYNGNEYQNGQVINVTNGTSQLKYKPIGNDGDVHNLTLVATNNFGMTKTTNLAFNVEIYPTLISASLHVWSETRGPSSNKDYRWTYQISYDAKLPADERIIQLKFEGQDRHGNYSNRFIDVSNPPLKQDKVNIWVEGWFKKPSSKTFDPNKTYTVKITTNKRTFTTTATMIEYQ